ncbi:MAG: sigma-70 family RNA polymerase sigma factor [Planctomycetes bacterium]|nr:sigma-70 family RNA polymerase sigma factor [Planctomycetota bacterium]
MTDQHTTRPSLMIRLQSAGDEAAWSEFVADYEPLILNLARRLGCCEADAQDICQQVLASVVRDIGQWTTDGKPASFRRWLFCIARHRALKFFLAERKRVIAAGGSDVQQRLTQWPDSDDGHEATLQREYRQQLLLQAARRIQGEFHPTTWSAFWKTCVDGLPIAQAARELQITPGNIYVARSRIIARLRDVVREMEDGSDA